MKNIALHHNTHMRPMFRHFMYGGVSFLFVLFLIFMGGMIGYTHKHFSQISRQTLVIVGSMAADTFQHALSLNIPLSDMRGVTKYLKNLESMHESISTIHLYNAQGIELCRVGQDDKHTQTLRHVSIPLMHDGESVGTLVLVGARNILPLNTYIYIKLLCICIGIACLWCFICWGMYARVIQPRIKKLCDAMKSVSAGILQRHEIQDDIGFEGDRVIAVINQGIIQAHHLYHTTENRLHMFCEKHGPLPHVEDMMCVLKQTYIFSPSESKVAPPPQVSQP